MQKTEIKIATRLFLKEFEELQKKLGISFLKDQTVLVPSNLSVSIVNDFCLTEEDKQVQAKTITYQGHDKKGFALVSWNLIPEYEIFVNRFMLPSDDELMLMEDRNERSSK